MQDNRNYSLPQSRKIDEQDDTEGLNPKKRKLKTATENEIISTNNNNNCLLNETEVNNNNADRLVGASLETTATQFKDLPDEIQTSIASYLDLPALCFFAQTSKRSLKAALPLLKARQTMPLSQSQWCMAVTSGMSIGYTSQALYVCGENSFGRLGLGDSNNRTAFTLVKDLPGTIQQVAAGYTHILALTSEGLYACGNNGCGQLGLGGNINRDTFTRIKDLPGTIQQVTAGMYHTLVLTSEGLYACGNNREGELGLGDTDNRNAFTLIKDTPEKIQQVIASHRHTLVLTSQGLYACGSNWWGELGLGDKIDRNTFTLIKNAPEKIQQVTVGEHSTYVLTDRELYACGKNGTGELGLGDTDDRKTFTLVKDLPGAIQQVATGYSHALVLTSQGLYACGNNSFGQLGPKKDKNYNNRSIFTLVKDLPGVIQQVATGYTYTLVLTSQGLYVCGCSTSCELGLQKDNEIGNFIRVTCLPSELKQLLTLNYQLETLLSSDERNTSKSDSEQVIETVFKAKT